MKTIYLGALWGTAVNDGKGNADQQAMAAVTCYGDTVATVQAYLAQRSGIDPEWSVQSDGLVKSYYEDTDGYKAQGTIQPVQVVEEDDLQV